MPNAFLMPSFPFAVPMSRRDQVSRDAWDVILRIVKAMDMIRKDCPDEFTAFAVPDLSPALAAFKGVDVEGMSADYVVLFFVLFDLYVLTSLHV